MCESAVYLMKGSEKSLIKAETSKILIEDGMVVCIGAFGEKIEVENAELSEINLMKHEIILRPKKG
ncbi:MAG: CooT family nickel-binding protein [Candidatus Thermoplasmatota archaeon]|nr:CooT family nickel-binding protein [Candidatus Thermoplasmatota archaeon]